ncbi:ethanolamine ammonia-lyase light chain, partial [Pseudomonas aeruginosa C3719]
PPTATVYLQRPGPSGPAPRRGLGATPCANNAAGYDGADRPGPSWSPTALSALAVQRHTLPFLERLEEQALAEGWSLSPVVLVEQGRVAVADEIGELLRAKMSVILIGERPGLSSPDSLGLYFTWAPRVGLTDAYRNCISNVRLERPQLRHGRAPPALPDARGLPAAAFRGQPEGRGGGPGAGRRGSAHRQLPPGEGL